MAGLASPPLSAHLISRELLVSLARTFDAAGEAVWIEDRAARCIYHNIAAQRQARPAGSRTFEMTDHLGRFIGRVITSAA